MDRQCNYNKDSPKTWIDCVNTTKTDLILFIYLRIYVAFNTVQVISWRVVLWAEETSTYS